MKESPSPENTPALARPARSHLNNPSMVGSVQVIVDRNGGLAKGAQLSGPKGLTIAPDGRVFIADTESHSIRVVDPRSGKIDVVCGNGKKGGGADGKAAECQLARPHGVFWDKDGTLYIGDSENHVVRAVTGLK